MKQIIVIIIISKRKLNYLHTDYSLPNIPALPLKFFFLYASSKNQKNFLHFRNISFTLDLIFFFITKHIDLW